MDRALSKGRILQVTNVQDELTEIPFTVVERNEFNPRHSNKFENFKRIAEVRISETPIYPLEEWGKK